MKMWEEAPITELFGTQIYLFGLYCAIGIVCATAAIFVLCRANQLKKGTASLLSCASIIGGILVSRLIYCIGKSIINDEFPFSAWIHLSSGGWSLFGMITGVFCAAWICEKISKEKNRILLDVSACALPLVIAAERFAERLFSEFNISRELSPGTFPEGTFLAIQDTDVSYMATYLLAAIASVILFIILVFFLTRDKKEDGDLWILFMILCGAGGILLESLRYDHHLEFSFVRFQQVIAAIFLVIGVVLAGIRNRGVHKGFFRTAVISLPLVIGACGGIEYALDRTTLSHYLLYLLMTVALAVPVTFGILLLRKREKGAETL